MNLRLSPTLLDRWFWLAALVKGLDGLVEVLTSVVLFAIPADRIRGTIAGFATNEIQEGKHAFVAHYVLTLTQKIDIHVQLFAAIYLLAHGCIKIGLAVALLKRFYQVFPYAIGLILAFVAYQSYLIGFNHSWILVALTLFDVGVAVLTYLEWQRHRGEKAAA